MRGSWVVEQTELGFVGEGEVYIKAMSAEKR